MSKPSLKDIDIVIAISDLHCGCQMGLCPPGGFLLDGGGKYKLSRTQTALFDNGGGNGTEDSN